MAADLQQGSSGRAVRALNEALAQIASDWQDEYLDPKSTGEEYGTDTAAAVARFQQRLDLDITYALDARTREQIELYYPDARGRLDDVDGDGGAEPIGGVQDDGGWRLALSGEPFVRSQRFWYTVLNEAPGTLAAGATTTTLRLFDENNIPVGAEILSHDPPHQLGAGESATVELEVPIPMLTEDGWYELRLQVDSDRAGPTREFPVQIENERLVDQ